MELTFALLGLLLVLVVIFFAVSCAFLLKFFIKSAPKDVQERMKGRLDQPAWKTALGVVLILAVSAGVIAIFIYAGNDAMSRGWGFWQIFVRYLILFEGYKIFDMVVFDYILLTRLNIFQHFYPEVIGCESMEHYGFNLKSQLVKIVVFAIVSAVVAFVLVQVR